MKRILLTTTSLVLAAGFASADISFSGTAGIALIDDNGASVATAAVIGVNGTATVAPTLPVAEVLASTRDGLFAESYYDLDITATAETDNGITVSVGFDMGAGNKIDYDDDDALEAQGGSIGDADVAVSYNGWTLAVDQAGIDNLFDDTDGSQDMSLSGSVMGLTVAFTTDQEGSTSSYKVGGTVGGVALAFTGTDNDDAGGDATGVSASYAMGDLTVSAAMSDESTALGAEDDTSVGLSYKMDALTFGYTTIKPGSSASFGDEWDFSVAYAVDAVSASFATDETDATTIIAEYTLGGGATAFAAMHDKTGTASDLTAIGLNFAF